MDEPDFETALMKLEGLVSALERGDGTLSTALTQYESGVHLLARCQGLLDSAEKSVCSSSALPIGELISAFCN